MRVGQGRAFDVAVDLRSDSPTYGQHQLVELTAGRANMLYIPTGFAHGFMALEEHTVFLYKCSDYYAPATEGGLRWDDADLKINWGTEVQPLVSGKDEELPAFKDFVSPF